MLRDPLRGPGVTVADVYAATHSVAAALEIVDSRIADWQLTLVDTVADNASSGAVAIGSGSPVPATSACHRSSRRWCSTAPRSAVAPAMR